MRRCGGAAVADMEDNTGLLPAGAQRGAMPAQHGMGQGGSKEGSSVRAGMLSGMRMRLSCLLFPQIVVRMVQSEARRRLHSRLQHGKTDGST